MLPFGIVECTFFHTTFLEIALNSAVMTETRRKIAWESKVSQRLFHHFSTRYFNLTVGKTNRSKKQDKCLLVYFLQKLLFSFRAKQGSWLRRGLIRFWAKSFIGQPSYSGPWSQRSIAMADCIWEQNAKVLLFTLLFTKWWFLVSYDQIP